MTSVRRPPYGAEPLCRTVRPLAAGQLPMHPRNYDALEAIAPDVASLAVRVEPSQQEPEEITDPEELARIHGVLSTFSTQHRDPHGMPVSLTPAGTVARAIENAVTDAVPASAPTSVTKTFAFPRVHSLTHETVPDDYGAEDHRRKVATRRKKAKAAKQARKHQAKLRRERR